MANKYLIKYSEIGIKGNNRYVFEDILVRNIKSALKDIEGSFDVKKADGRIYVESDAFDTVQRLQKVFGIAGICPVTQIEKCGFEQIKKEVIDYIRDKHDDGKNHTFKCNARRADKSFFMTSVEINERLGEAIIEEFENFSVDIHEPEVLLNIEVRPKVVNIYSDVIMGLSGMPVGSSGKAMLLLSGGIDSPVAGYLTAKRGVSIDAVYFHAPPYTSERAKQKVIDLAKKVSEYAGPINLYVINFTEIQMKIYEICPHDELTIIMRRYMMKIAEHFARKEGALGLVTGESIGQVASQTMQSMLVTNAACSLPVYRPLCAFDKLDIVEIAERIDTYETSILPYEDCCTIFVAKHPVTKPKLERIEKSEKKLSGIIEELFEKAIDTAEIIEI